MKKRQHRSSHLDRACSQKANKEKEEKARSFPEVETRTMIDGLEREPKSKKRQRNGKG